MHPFSCTALPSRVIFGAGTISQLGAEIDALGCGRALLVSTPGKEVEARKLEKQLANRCAGVFAGAVMHTPAEVTDTAMHFVDKIRADCIVGIGGGSTVGLGKAISLRTGLPQIAIPTTYAGSEATPILGETKNAEKVTQRSLKVLPKTIIYDVELTLSLPVKLSASSGMNAIAHAAEALYARDANPITSLLAEDAIRVLAKALPEIVINPQNQEARSDALYGAWLCGICLGMVGMSIHHKLCHTLGGRFGLPHAETHAVLLPYALAYTASFAPDAMAVMGRALGASDAVQGLYGLARCIQTPRSLKEIGMPANALEEAADLATASPYWSPRPMRMESIRALLDDAFFGHPPRTY